MLPRQNDNRCICPSGAIYSSCAYRSCSTLAER
jgi:hypothetical protein